MTKAMQVSNTKKPRPHTIFIWLSSIARGWWNRKHGRVCHYDQ